MRVQFSPLTKQHDRASFDCGDEEMNGFVRHFLAQQVKAGETSCYVLEDADTYEIIGLFTLNPSSVPREQIPWSEKFAYPMVSVYLLGRLAVSAKHQGMGYGKLMIKQAISMLVTPDVPRAVGLLTELKSDELKNFYHNLGFVDICPNPLTERPRMLFPFTRPKKLPIHPT